jgi:hypothetical protein
MKCLLLSYLLLLLSASLLHGQGICDSTISIAPIEPLCEGTGEGYLEVSHPGGVFSGPGLNPSSSYLNARFVPAGIHTATYTIVGPGGCMVQATQTFEVLDAVEATLWASGQIDCSDPNSTVTLNAFWMNNHNFLTGEWYGESANMVFEGNVTTSPHAGNYYFHAISMDFNECPAFGNLEVKFKNNPLPINLVSCVSCADVNPVIKIKIDTVPLGWHQTITHENSSYFGANNCIPILHTGEWFGTVKNPANSCISKDSKIFTSKRARPIVSAGSNINLPCGAIRQFVTATNPQNDPWCNFFWTTPNGSTVPASYASVVTVNEPGMYILQGENTFTGCTSRDTAFAIAAPTPISTQIKVICAGDSLLGYTQTGNYTDTLTLPNGCKQTQITKLIVLAPILDTVVVAPDNGQMNGSIHYTVTQGWPPFLYSWNTGETDASIVNLAAGTYTITVTDVNGCQRIREVEVPINKPSKRLSTARSAHFNIEARCYPNPVVSGNGQCTLEIISSQSSAATLLLTDVLGRNISTRNVQLLEGKNVFPLSENLPEGMYAVFLKGNFGVKEISKLIVSDRE